jgi:hypothetical protein
MYIRFTTPGTVTRAGIAPGPFTGAHQLSWRHHDEPLGEALWHELHWFNTHLPVPRGKRPFSVRSKRRWYKDGVCWFRDDAREMLTHAHVMAALIEECGVPVVRRLAEHPGQILYRDAWQVVAKPDNCRRRCRADAFRRHRRRFISNPAATGGRDAAQRRIRHAPVLSSGHRNGVGDTPAKRASSAGCASYAAARWSCWRSWAATILAPAARGRGFKACCMKSGRFDGAERRDYWR